MPESLPPTNIEIPEKISEPTPEIKKSDRVKIFFYLNGVLMENRGEHTTAGDILIENYQSWKRIKIKKFGGEYFLFPANYTARLVIENFTDKDLITPHIEIRICDEEIFFDKPTIKSGEILNLEIPIANKHALEILGEDNIHGKISILVESPSHENIVLIRDLEI